MIDRMWRIDNCNVFGKHDVEFNVNFVTKAIETSYFD